MYAPFYESSQFGIKNHISGFVTDNITFPPHMHMYFEVFYVTKGMVEMTINQNTNKLYKGDFGVVLSDDIHSYRTEDESEAIIFIFSPEYITETIPKLGKAGYDLETHFLLNSMEKDNQFYEEMRSCILQLLQEIQTTRQEAVIKGYIHLFFGRFLQSVLLQPIKTFNKRYSIDLQKITKYLQENFEKKITLEDISHETGLNKFYISHMFKTTVQYSLNNYLNILRINRAQYLLYSTPDRILDISLQCGFESQRHFNRVFKEIVGITALEYRKSYGSQNSQ
jgi:AraC-like DNA-binding protein/mannose-6-phosphate isomerase-like protein (cupin superfamily)